MAHPLTTIGNFSYDALNKELELTAREKETLDVFLKAYLDDFWQEGKVTLLPGAVGARSGDVTNLLEKRFVFRNVIRECVARVAGAFFGKGPNWRFLFHGEAIEDTEEASSEMLGAIDKALGEFYTKQRVAEVASKAFQSRLAFGRGGMRIYIPAKYKRQNLVPTEGEQQEDYVKFESIVDAIKAMRVEYIPPTQARQLEEDGEYFSIVKYQKRTNWEINETQNVIEFSFVDDNEMTFVGTLHERGAVKINPNPNREMGGADLSSGFDLSGTTTYREFEGDPYVTKGLFKNNQLVNLALTCAGFSLVDNGFGEMVLTNVELETESVEGPDGQVVEIPKRIRRGGGVVQNFVGVQTFDDTTGGVRREAPGVTFKEPSSMTSYKDGFDLAYAACLQEADQLHALISGDATASGESRIQALINFVLRIKPYKSEVDEHGSWFMTGVLLWAAALAGVNLTGYAIAFDSRLHVTELSDGDKRLIMDMRARGTISRETERVLLGIDDPHLEAERVLEEQRGGPSEITITEFSEKLDVGLKMLSINIDPLTIQKYLGYTAAEIKKMQEIAAEMTAQYQAEAEAAAGASVGAPDDEDVESAEGAPEEELTESAVA